MTLSFNLPLPVANGAGAAVDVSTLGAPLTLTCVGQLAGANIAIEVSNDGGTTWSPLIAWQNVGGERVVPAAIQWMRTNVAGRGSKPFLTFSANLDVAGPGVGMTAVSLPMPVANGAGAAVDTSALEQLCTFVCTGAFPGCSIAVQISEDNVGWSPLVVFGGTGGVITKILNANWMRVFVSGRETGIAFSGLMAVGAASVGDQPITDLLVQDEGVDVVSTTTMNFVGAGVTVTDVGGVATVTIPGAGSAAVTDNSITGAGTVPDPFTVHPGGLVAPATVVGIAKPTVQTVLFEDFLSTGLVDLTASVGCTADTDNPGGYGIEAQGMVVLFVDNTPGNFARVFTKTATAKGLYLDSASVTRAVFQARVAVPSGTAPTAIADYEVCIGWNSGGGTHGSGLFFALGFADQGFGTWGCKVNCGPSADPNPVDTGVVVDAAAHLFTIDYDPTTTTALFYIDGALVATFANVPNPFNFTGVWPGFVGVGPVPAVPSANAFVVVDWMYCRVDMIR